MTASPSAPPITTRSTALRLIDSIPLFASLTEAEKETLAATLTRKTYRTGDVLAEQGATLNSLVVIRNGVIAVTRRERDEDVELDRLAPGDYFGEGGLFTRTGEPATVRALTAVVAYEVGQAALAKLMQDRPSIADEISVTLSRRTKSQTSIGDDGHAVAENSVARLVGRIRQLFEVPRN